MAAAPKLTIAEEKKKKRGMCVSLHCKKSHRERSNFCHSCEKKKYREKNPVMSTYTLLRSNAKRRGKRFVITIEEFKQWVVKHDYMDGKGTGSSNKTIDCINPLIGYQVDNMQVLTNAENIRKMHHDKKMMDKYGYYAGNPPDSPPDNETLDALPVELRQLPTAPF